MAEFDVVIVGAGSAGCVLANRLSADPAVSVALVEAGGRDLSPWIHVPVGYFKTIKDPALNWMYRTQPDPGLNGRALNWPRGKTLGGSSSINGLLYVRGQPQDYDRWRQMGNVGWGWDDVAPLFRRSEAWEDGGDDLRGGDGELTVSRSRQSWRVVDAWVEAAKAEGFAFNPDYNGESQEGVGYFQLTARNGLRCSSAKAFLGPARRRPNLKIYTHVEIHDIELDGPRAVAVRGRRHGSPLRIGARGEIVLSAGAIGSPQILMLSGIGAGTELGRHGIQVRHEIDGVGKNLQDHLQARPIYRCTTPTINTRTRGLFNQARIGFEYMLNRSGPLTLAASLGTGFLKTRPDLETPDIQFHIQPFSANNPTTDTDDFDAFTASVLQLRPESAGEIRLNSAQAGDPPLIHPNYLATPLDQQTIVEGIRMARRICRQSPVRELIVEEHAPGAPVADEDFDGLLDWARNTATTIYHPTGTCKMGADAMAVVDDRLRVHGIERLRVADASIMPSIVSGNTNAPAIMIGEKASDLVREDMRA
ncbi:GMC family oxidoreductase N-terminal domain-containing protein [uncultured Hoeflea sp.]|uniref:GMC family oxidoreductase n=1 Tax=uncultured Hoeflea sp. TaxID=538666 RepID=UPI002625B4A0|nr:GMC family oxidoreductase N-terminal domain-containing protein [uncultured Hoeflea sp.]